MRRAVYGAARMRVKDKCPSCFQPVAPDDFLCANCELILSPSMATTRPVGEISVVRRLLEIPQRGVPSNMPTRPQTPAISLGEPGFEGPTRVMSLPPEIDGVPVVVATLSKPAVALTELEAWVVSLIDGLHDAPALAQKVGFKELELRVVLSVLQSKGVVDFADEPLSDADLELPSVLGTLDEPVSEDVPVITGEFETQPPPPPLEDDVQSTDQHFVPPRVAATPSRGKPAIEPLNVEAPTDPGHQPTVRARPVRSANQLPAYPAPPRGAVVSHGVATSSAQREAATTPAQPAIPAYPGAARARPQQSAQRGDFAPVPTADTAPTEAARPAVSSSPAAHAAPVEPKREVTDPRIQYSGKANRRVLDALKQVKRNDAPVPSAASKEDKQQTFADVMARDTLQVALRMEQNGRLDEAIRFLEKSIAQSPDAPSLYNRLGIILMRERADYRRAEQLIRKAIELAPENTVYATNLQQVLSRDALRTQR